MLRLWPQANHIILYLSTTRKKITHVFLGWHDRGTELSFFLARAPSSSFVQRHFFRFKAHVCILRLYHFNLICNFKII